MVWPRFKRGHDCRGIDRTSLPLDGSASRTEMGFEEPLGARHRLLYDALCRGMVRKAVQQHNQDGNSSTRSSHDGPYTECLRPLARPA